jgi:hypothetical protein
MEYAAVITELSPFGGPSHDYVLFQSTSNECTSQASERGMGITGESSNRANRSQEAGLRWLQFARTLRGRLPPVTYRWHEAFFFIWGIPGVIESHPSDLVSSATKKEPLRHG